MKKRTIAMAWAFTLLFTVNAYSEEIQISDYRYTKCEHLMDGYTYCASGDRAEILKPSGHKLYSMSKYTAPYSMGYEDSENHPNLLTITYPQGENGHTFIVYSPSKKKMGLMNKTSEIIAPLEYNDIRLMGPNYFFYYKNEKRGVLSALDGHVMGETDMYVYIADDMLHYAFADIFTKNGREYASAEFYNSEGKMIDSFEGKELSSLSNYDSEKRSFKDSFGNNYRKLSLGNGLKYIELPWNDPSFYPWEFNGYDAIQPSMNGESASDRVNDDYYFKEKIIADKTYYAVFANLSDSDKAATEISYESDDRKSSITDSESADCFQLMREDNFISISQYCCFEDNMTKRELCILLLNTYMYDQGLDIADYAKDIDISDVGISDDVYIRLALKLGLIDAEPDSDFNPYDTITRGEAAICFDRLARLMGNKGSLFGRPFFDTFFCSGEHRKALRHLSKLKNADLGYVIVSEDGKIDPLSSLNAEDAYKVAYKLATYNKAGSYKYILIKDILICLVSGLVGTACFVFIKKRRAKRGADI